ncbi:MAG TPA: universal stress protein, partial [Rhodobacteraceae bacterium]|nr:universal stress protein [Paracoccaceae bacterium]
APMPGLAQLLAHLTRLSDLVVLPRPYGENRGHEHEAIVESELFDASVPVLVVPDGGKLPDPIGKIVIAWNESHEALVAVRAALPFLRQAEAVNIAIVDPPPHAPDRSDPGGALSQMLARHDVKADVSILARTMPRVSDVIARHLVDQAADLLVMGAYGHSRIRESILGGATRHMLQTARIPILMAH